MGRIIGKYGVIAGVLVAIGMAIGMTLVPHGGTTGMIAGYLSMLVALSMVFVGVRQYRDTVQGGVIRFLPAFGVGLSIAFIASLFYVFAWEIYMAASHFSFAEDYVGSMVKSMEASGKSAADIAKFKAEMAEFVVQYANPLFRMPMTFMEIAPVGLLVSLVSAALLRNSSFLPAKAPR